MNDGAGYALLRMKPATRQFILDEDTVFAKDVIAHNMQCQRDKLCKK